MLIMSTIPAKHPQQKKDFLQAKLYYLNADSAEEVSQSEDIRKRAYYIWKKEGMPQDAAAEIWAKAKNETLGNETQENPVNDAKETVHSRLSNLEEAYTNMYSKLFELEERLLAVKQKKEQPHPLPVSERSIAEKADLVDKLNTQEIEINRLMGQISLLEEERVLLLGQITAIERENIAAMELDQQKITLQEHVSKLNQSNESLQAKVEEFKKINTDQAQTISSLGRTKNALFIEKERDNLEKEIAQLRHENEILEDKTSSFEQERSSYQSQINELNERAKALTYLDKKSEMLEEEIQESEKEKERLIERIEDYERECKAALEKIADLEKSSYDLQELTTEKDDLARKIINLETKHVVFLEQIANLEFAKKELEQELSEKVSGEAGNKLKDRIDELEQERINLFKMICELEEEKKVLQYLDKKTSLLEEELKQSESAKDELFRQIEEYEVERKELISNNSMLEEKRNTRLELEQENGSLAKKVSELENINQLNRKKIEEYKEETDQLEQSSEKPEYYKVEIAKLGLEKGNLLQKTEDLELMQKQLAKRIAVLESKDKLAHEEIEALKRERQELMGKLARKSVPLDTPYVLDREKLTELKDFTLEAIQARRWKSTEFVNGAYDAIGLFYRTILSDRPIIKKIK